MCETAETRLDHCSGENDLVRGRGSGVSRAGCWRGGERQGGQACPVVDHGDLGADVETVVDWPLPTSTTFCCCCCFLTVLCVHTLTGLAQWSCSCTECMGICQKMLMACLYSFPKQIQMSATVCCGWPSFPVSCSSLSFSVWGIRLRDSG